MITNALIKENGNLSFFHRYNDKDVFICNSTNSAVNSGSSVVSNALAGNGGIKYLYVAYMNGDGTISYPSIQPSTDISYFTSLINPYGCIKVPAYLVGDVGAGMVTMQGITASNLTPIAGDSFVVDSKVYAIGLVGVVNGVDTLFAIANITDENDDNSYVSKLANAQIGINWTVSTTIG